VAPYALAGSRMRRTAGENLLFRAFAPPVITSMLRSMNLQSEALHRRITASITINRPSCDPPCDSFLNRLARSSSHHGMIHFRM